MMSDFFFSSHLLPGLINIPCVYSEVRIEGLETVDYLDNLSQRARFTEQGNAITFESEVHLFAILDAIV